MPNLQIKRKLTAILSADVEGYSHLMRNDEVTTIRTLTEYKETISALIQQHRGRVVDAPGDNLLAEFASVVDAVQCAAEIQRVLADCNEELSPECKMYFRIGVNLGDVVEEKERIYGDGVNIAARLARVQKALFIDENECEAHRIIGAVYLAKKQFDKAEYHISKAIALNPNDAHIAVKAASFYSYTRRYQEAMASVKRAMRLNPRHPDWYWQELGLAFYAGEQYNDAILAFNRMANLVEFDDAYLAACCVGLGEIEQAKSHIASLRQIRPRASIRYYEKSQQYKNDADLQRFLDALRKAGLN